MKQPEKLEEGMEQRSAWFMLRTEKPDARGELADAFLPQIKDVGVLRLRRDFTS